MTGSGSFCGLGFQHDEGLGVYGSRVLGFRVNKDWHKGLLISGVGFRRV